MKKVYMLYRIGGEIACFESEEIREEFIEKYVVEKSIVKSECDFIKNSNDIETYLNNLKKITIESSIKMKLTPKEIEYLKNKKLGDG